MTAESDKSVTVNRPHKQEWERFFPENPLVELPQYVSLKTFWNTYVTARTSGSIDAITKYQSQNAKL